jgi:flavin reductase (DIM6/NTAB) family NADH-FMN oxidoreductase RutF
MGKWTLVLGEVVAFHCADGLLDARFRVDLDRLQAVGRLSGNQYCRTGERFSLSRSDDSPDKKLNV